jgi:long-chain acyl-CoA synthetase
LLPLSDRKKDLVKLAHGEYISLGRVEHTLRRSEFIDNICVVASIKHNFVVALIVPNRKHLHRLAEEVGAAYSTPA